MLALSSISYTQLSILNEVLSLNAQECLQKRTRDKEYSLLLNEVLSLNAQEYAKGGFVGFRNPSSMKS